MRNYKEDFPLLKNSDIVYLDSAATAQRSYQVLEAERAFYERWNANPLRGLYQLGIEATEHYEEAREAVRRFIHAKKASEIIFTRNATESLNLVAYSYGLANLHEGDEIVISIAEHHSNMLPWQMVAEKTGAKLKYLLPEPDGSYTDEAIEAAMTPAVKLLAMAQVSNVLGCENPLQKLIPLVHKNGGVAVVDGAQSTPHMAVDVTKLDADFFAFSGHKLMAPMGIGVLYGKEELLEKMPPFLTGGEMIESVTTEGAVYAELPHKFEAGTVNGGGAWGLKAAIDYIEELGIENLEARECELTKLAYEKLTALPHIKILGSNDPAKHCGILSFAIDGVHPHDIASILDADHIAVRAGHHCAQPLLKHLGVFSTARASIAFYNTEEDIERFVKSVSGIRREMGYGE